MSQIQVRKVFYSDGEITRRRFTVFRLYAFIILFFVFFSLSFPTTCAVSRLSIQFSSSKSLSSLSHWLQMQSIVCEIGTRRLNSSSLRSLIKSINDPGSDVSEDLGEKSRKSSPVRFRLFSDRLHCSSSLLLLEIVIGSLLVGGIEPTT